MVRDQIDLLQHLLANPTEVIRIYLIPVSCEQRSKRVKGHCSILRELRIFAALLSGLDIQSDRNISGELRILCDH